MSMLKLKKQQMDDYIVQKTYFRKKKDGNQNNE